MSARPRQTEARDTRRELVDAALELFADKGFYGTSLRDIARAVGVRESAIYHHFASKEALFEAVLFDADELGARLGPLPPPTFTGNHTDLLSFFERYIASMLERFSTLREQKRFRIMMSDGARLAAENKVNYFDKMAVARQPVFAMFESLMDRGLLRRQSPELTGMLLMAPLLLWRQMLTVAPDSPMAQQPRAFARTVAEQFLVGAAAPANRPTAAPKPHPPAAQPHLNSRSLDPEID